MRGGYPKLEFRTKNPFHYPETPEPGTGRGGGHESVTVRAERGKAVVLSLPEAPLLHTRG
jgi:hypothetical protein